MGYQQQCLTGPFLPQKRGHLVAGIGIQAFQRFVQQQNITAVSQCAADGDALLLSARKLVGIFVPAIGKPHCLQQLLCPGKGFGAIGQHHIDVVHRRQPGEEGRFLKNIADLAVDRNLAGVGGQQSGNHVDERGFSAARRAHQCHAASGFHPERAVFQHLLTAVGQGQTVDGDHASSPPVGYWRPRRPMAAMSTFSMTRLHRMTITVQANRSCTSQYSLDS